MRRKLVVANWKMNGSLAANAAWVAEFRAAAAPGCEVVVCAPFVYLEQLARDLAAVGAAPGAQDLSVEAPGAFTGEVAAEMLADVGCNWVIVGHSERRALHGETNELVAAKAARALALGLRPIVCVGETLAEREAGDTERVVGSQLAGGLRDITPDAMRGVVLAYEPVWAIGTGRTATPEQAQAVHAFIRSVLADQFGGAAADAVRIQYGGSVKPSNAAALLGQPDIDGALVGGASLDAASFLGIIQYKEAHA